MRPAWTRGVWPLVAALVLLAGTVGLASLLELEAGTRPGWASTAFVALLASPLLVARVYPDLRTAQLYALVFLSLPLGAVHLLAESRALEDWEPLARLAPALAEAAPDALLRLQTFSFLAWPLLVLTLTWIPADPPRPLLRRWTTWFLLAEVLAGAAWLAATPAELEREPALMAVVPALGLLGAGVALVLWRSPAGLGGGVAGFLTFVATAGLAQLGGDLSPVAAALPATWQDGAEDWLHLPEGSRLVLILALAPLLLLLVAYEWVAQLVHRTRTDALTQIYNKAYADSIMDQTGGTDLGERYAVALADIDHFKRVNDEHGHAAGDAVLQQAAAAIREVVGKAGVVCRTGGEEITIFFPGLACPEAQVLCERLRVEVAGRTMRARGPRLRWISLKVTLSVGVASNLDEHGERIHARVREVVEAADRALYAAKRQGRNRVVVMES